jgi:transcriptional regulator with XRE-family HTH domain
MTDARATSAMDHALGKKLRQAREAAGLSQQGLAQRLGITFQQIQKYERGANRIAASRLVSIARALDKPLSYFLDDAKANGQAARLDQAASGLALGAIESAKVRGRLSDLLRAIIDVEAAKKAARAAPRVKSPAKKPAKKVAGRAPRR